MQAGHQDLESRGKPTWRQDSRSLSLVLSLILVTLPWAPLLSFPGPLWALHLPPGQGRGLQGKACHPPQHLGAW